MVKINYFKDMPHVFELSFKLREYIPSKYFQHEVGLFAEIRFFIDLFKENNMLKSSSIPRIWTTEFACVYNDLPLIMIYDEDYGFVHFAVESSDDTAKIAEVLKHLVESAALKTR
ncbi:MAG: hypothetical protein FWD99_07855 [Oscillospiraceae bacterium]|nr:hypothetical protein [Oscillospiraceae bacterium]